MEGLPLLLKCGPYPSKKEDKKMKNTFYAALTTVLFLAAGFAAQPGRAASMFDNPTPLAYERYDKYFEKNNSGFTAAASVHMFLDRLKFDRMFAGVPSMGPGTYLPQDVFETRFVFAVVKRGGFTVKYRVNSVVRDFSTLHIYYEATQTPIKGSIVHSPLILAIDNVDFDYSEIIVTENGKDVYRENLKD